MEDFQVFSAIKFAFKQYEYSCNVDQVVNAINQIRQSYSINQINTINASLINYDQSCYQLAYIFVYLTSHVNIVHELLNEFWLLHSDLANSLFINHVSICSIGGGPGSEIIGLSWFLKEKFEKCSIFGDIFDRYPEWQSTFERLANALMARGLKNIGNVSYQQFDFFKDINDIKVRKSISNAKIVTIVKFISAVGFDRRLAEMLLTNLLLNVQPGTIVLFVDNDGGGYLELMNKSANLARLSLKHEVVRRNYEVTKRMWMECFETDLPCNFPRKESPQKSARVSGSIWYKPEPLTTRNNNFTPTIINFTPTINNFTPTINNFTPTINNFSPRINNFSPRINNFTPRINNFTPGINLVQYYRFLPTLRYPSYPGTNNSLLNHPFFLYRGIDINSISNTFYPVLHGNISYVNPVIYTNVGTSVFNSSLYRNVM